MLRRSQSKTFGQVSGHLSGLLTSSYTSMSGRRNSIILYRFVTYITPDPGGWECKAKTQVTSPPRVLCRTDKQRSLKSALGRFALVRQYD